MKKKLTPLLFIFLLFGCAKEKDAASNKRKDSSSQNEDLLGMPKNSFLKNGILKEGKINGRDIKYYQYGDLDIFEGDIIVSTPYGRPQTESTGRANEIYRWPRRSYLSEAYGTNEYLYEVNYSISPDVPNQQRITDAIAHWESKTNLRFIQSNSLFPLQKILFTAGNVCASEVGMQANEQKIILAPGCSTPTVIHEIGHAIGLWHEHTRADRDNYVRINWSNILSEKEHNFQTYNARGEDGFQLGSFDFSSVMMYGFNDFSKNGLPTIERIDNGNGPWPNGYLSAEDINTVNYMYPKGGYSLDNLHLYVINYSRIRKVDSDRGGWISIGLPEWSSTKAITSYNGYIYIVQNSRLHRVDPVSGSYIELGGPWWSGTEAITASSNGFLYIVQNSRLHKVNPADGSYTVLGNPEWGGTQGMAAYNGSLYVVQNAHLHKVDENSGDYSVLGPNWAGTQSVVSANNGYLYIVQNSRIHKVNASTGDYTIIGDPDWAGVSKATFYNGYLYVIQNSRIHKVNKDNGSYTVLGYPDWANAEAITAF